MLFNFQLRQLANIEPWHDKDGTQHLHWFGLSDGWYWIKAGRTELFRYTEAEVERDRREHPNAYWLDALPYVDYQVARLWEDLIEIMPEALNPVSPRLAGALGLDGPWNAWEQAAQRAVKAAIHTTTDESAQWALDGMLDDACQWWWERHLDSAYLIAGPQIWFWCDETTGYVQWDNRRALYDGRAIWEANTGIYTMPREDFAAEFRAFCGRFLGRMADRIAIAQTNWTRPDIALDSTLNANQQDAVNRFARVEAAMAQRDPDRWVKVFDAIAFIEALPTFNGPGLP